ncbi:MAG: HD-GYP domain-containing protein [Betaproteobacteria bacterium]
MPLDACIRIAEPVLETLQALERRLPSMERAELARSLAPLVERLRDPLPPDRAAETIEATLRFCRLLYSNARSRYALPLAEAVLAQANLTGTPAMRGRAATACGVLCADTGDPVNAIEHHVVALRCAEGDRLMVSRCWNNMGLAMAVAANYEMASRCYNRGLALLEGVPGILEARYVALLNLARSQYELGAYEDGLVSGYLALQNEGEMLARDGMAVLRLRRNLVRLLVAVGRVADAEPYMLEAMVLAERIRTPLAAIAASLARGVYELARGETDIGLTRLDAVLAQARAVPATLPETLACVMRAEEMAGHSERALMRLGELSDHIYRPAVEAARQHIELASLADRERMAIEHEQEQVRARLISKLAPPQRPEGWSALERLGVNASMRVDNSGWHGKRVGALSKALAMASGVDALHALEIGFACELHDIGMVSVPEEMLLKRPMQPEVERAVIERHVRAGAEILSDDEHSRIFLAREVVRYHHAHWDGSGHPQGVAGKRIPLAARICAVADGYDDLVCGLRGTPRATMDDALRELRAAAGRRYDPELVTCFESMIRTETDDLGLDLAADSGMENFQQLVSALQEDRGFV